MNPGARIAPGKSRTCAPAGTSLWSREVTCAMTPSSMTSTGREICSKGVSSADAVKTVLTSWRVLGIRIKEATILYAFAARRETERIHQRHGDT